MKDRIYLLEIARYFAWFISQMKIENSNGDFDINKYAERFLLPILNLIFNKEFERLEYIKQNYPAIDIGSKDNQISIQVTSEKGFDKIKNTLNKFVINEVYKDYKELYHLVLNEDYKTNKSNDEIKIFIDSVIKNINPKPNISFLKEKHLLNISKILGLIEQNCNTDQIEEIRNYLNKIYGDVTVLPNFENTLMPYEIVFKKQLNSENQNLPYQFHNTYFGREDLFIVFDEFIKDKKNSVLSIVADGGYGKTRFVIEAFKKNQFNGTNTEFLVLSPRAFKCINFSEQIDKSKQLVILFDDAHKNPEILNDLIELATRFDNVKLVLTVRKAVYSETIENIKTHNRFIKKYEIERLGYDDTKALFKSVLPTSIKEYEFNILSEQSRGIPVVVLGLCESILKDKYNEKLTGEENFIQFVGEVKEQVVTDINKKYYESKDKIVSVIDYISFFSPIENENIELEKLAEISKIDIEKLSLIIDYLSEYDFIRKGKTISIIPDPYSDIILFKASKKLRPLLLKDIGFFKDRLLINIMNIEQASGFDLNIDNLLNDFITSFKKKKTDTDEGLRKLDKNLITLQHFIHKKTELCFLAIGFLIKSKLVGDMFWNEFKDNDFSPLKDVHKNIEESLTMISLNFESDHNFERLYDTIEMYSLKKPKSKIFKKVFRYREFDFRELGYARKESNHRQIALVNKLKSLEKDNSNEDILNRINNCCSIFLSLDFPAETHYDKYKSSFSIGTRHIFKTKSIDYLRQESIKLLIEIYNLSRYTESSEDYFDEVLRILFYISRSENHYDQTDEVDVVIEFLFDVLAKKPSVFERSSIIKRISIFERKGKQNEIKLKYREVLEKLINQARDVDTPKKKLILILKDDYFSLEEGFQGRISQLISDEYPDWNTFYKDLIQINKADKTNDIDNFHVVKQTLIEKFPQRAKELLDYVLNSDIEEVLNYTTLIKANYQDEKYFYEIIDKIWNSKIDRSESSVLWMLTNGRNKEISLYKVKDLQYFEEVIKEDLDKNIWIISHAIDDYILIEPKKTIELLKLVLEKSNNKNEQERLLSGIFTNAKVLEKEPELIKDFIFNNTLDVPLGNFQFDKALVFLENNFGFDVLFEYLKTKVLYLEKEDEFFYTSFDTYHTNPEVSDDKKEKNFLKVIEWYSKLENSSEYLHKKFVEYLKPNFLSSNFLKDFEEMVLKSENLKSLISMCEAIDFNIYKNDNILSLLINISNIACEKFNECTDINIQEILGHDFIHNSGMKSGTAGQPFPQDISRLETFQNLVKNHKMHYKVKDVFSRAIDSVKKGISIDRTRDSEKW